MNGTSLRTVNTSRGIGFSELIPKSCKFDVADRPPRNPNNSPVVRHRSITKMELCDTFRRLSKYAGAG